MLPLSNLNNIFQSTAARTPPPKATRGRSGAATSPSDRSSLLAFPGDGEGHFRLEPGAYSAALATAAFSFSSKASMRRAVACGDFVKRASRL